MIRKAMLISTSLAFAACTTIENPDIVGQQLDGVWVFTYETDPQFGMDALHGGAATVDDGCLQVGDMVVVWRDEQLDAVQDALDAIADGDTPIIQLGGGGSSLDEGAALEDFPDAVLEHCTAVAIWEANGDEVSVTFE